MQNILQRLHLTRRPRVKTHSNHTYDTILVLRTLKVTLATPSRRVSSKYSTCRGKRTWSLGSHGGEVMKWKMLFKARARRQQKTRERAFGRLSSAHLSREASAFQRLVCKRLSDTSGPLLRFQSGRRTLMKQMAKV